MLFPGNILWIFADGNVKKERKQKPQGRGGRHAATTRTETSFWRHCFFFGAITGYLLLAVHWLVHDLALLLVKSDSSGRFQDNTCIPGSITTTTTK